MKSRLLRPLRYEVPCVLADVPPLYLPLAQIKRLDDLIDTRNPQRSGRGEALTMSATCAASLRDSTKAKPHARLVGETNSREQSFPANRAYAVFARLGGGVKRATLNAGQAVQPARSAAEPAESGRHPQASFRKVVRALVSASLLLPAGLAANYALNVVLARSLPVDGYGTFAFAQSLGGVLALAAALGFSGSMMRLVATYRSAGESERLVALIRYSLRVIVVCSAAMAVLLLAASLAFNNRGPGLLWAGLFLIPLAVDVWRESTMRGFHRISAAILPRQVLLPLCTLAVVLVAGISDTTAAMGVFLGALVLLEGWSLLQLRGMLPTSKKGTPLPFERKHWLGISLPMGLSSLALFGITRWDVAALGLFVGLEAAGPYAAAARTALLGSMVLRIINLVIAPWLAESYHGGEIGRFRKQLVYSTIASGLLGLPLFIVVFLFPEQVMGLFGPGYEQAAPLLRILAVAQFVNLITGPAGLALTMSKYERLNLVITFIAAAASFLGLLLFTKSYGAEGVALVTASAIILQNLLLFIVCIVLFSHAEPRDAPS